MKTEDIYHESSLPPILDSYQSALCPDKAAGLFEYQRQRRRQSSSRSGPITKSSANVVDADPGLERKRKALLDQRHLETYYKIHHLKDMLGYQYAALLKEKVERQRQEMKSPVPDNSRLTEGLKKQKSVSLHKLTRSSPIHDDTYLRRLPKTQHYLVLELQKQLVRLGYLQSLREQEVFGVWVEQHRNTRQLQKQLKAVEHSSPDVTLEDLLKLKSGSLPKLQIRCNDSTAQHKPMPVSLKGGKGGGVNSFQGKKTSGQDEIELMFPEIFTREPKVPEFSALQSTFLEEANPIIHLKIGNELPIKSKTIDVMQKIRLMHSLSLSYMADTQRIMAKTGLGSHVTDGFSIRELMESEYSHKVQTQKSRCPAKPIESGNAHFTPSLQPAEKSAEESPSSSAEHSPSSYIDPTLPLCLADICAAHSFEAEKRDKKMWTNYTQSSTDVDLLF
ncbi:uncharacterized protein si:ch211-130h14.4 isoform X3 [Danio rerio]|uniref:Uncharacterized protein si:ch211-130h14.4 isoform X3 n=2 Tax=Danio rerio TaxID=7955 RepID=A0AC58H3V1_DANRE